MLYIQNCICFCCNSFPLQLSVSQMCHSLGTATSDAFQPFMLSRFPSLTAHVSSKLPSPVNCLNSPIYTSRYLARVLLPCRFSLPSFILPVNDFLLLPNHLTLLIHFVSYFWTPSPFSKRFLGFNVLIQSTQVSCRLHCTQYAFIDAHLHTASLETLHFYFCRFVLEGGNRNSCATTTRWRPKWIRDPAALSMLAHLNIFSCSTSWTWLLNLH